MKRGLQYLIPLLIAGLAVVLMSPGANAQAPEDNLEVVLAIDTSGSMHNAIGAAKAAALEFVAAMPAEVRIGVETFGDSVTMLTPPTADRALLTEQINSIVTGGNTALYDVVVSARQQFTPSVTYKVLVVLSDGKDDGSRASLQDAIDSVQGEYVEAISLTTSETDLTSLTALGRVTSADDAAGMSAAFARVANLIAVVVDPSVVPSTAAPTTTVVAPTTVAVTTPVAAEPTVTTVSTPAPASAAVVAPTHAAPATSLLWVGGVGLFAGLFLLAFALLPRERVSKARLGIDKQRGMSDIGTRTMSAVEDALERHGMRARLATTLAVAEISMRPGEFLGTVAVVALLAGFVGLLIGGPLLALIATVVVCLAVNVYVSHAKAKRQAAFADQLPDVLQLLTTALRTGFGLMQALDSVADEAEEPARAEFTHVLVEARLGRDLSDAMRALAQRMDSQDLEWVVAAIDINRETGGNLSEILGTVAATIRERQRMARQVRTLTAEGRLSARILTVLPFVMALWQWRVNKQNFTLLTHGGGLVALVIAGVLVLLGTFWTHKIVNSLSS